MESGAESLARSRSGQLEWLAGQYFIGKEDLPGILRGEVSGDLVGRMAVSLHSMIDDYLLNGYSLTKIKLAVRLLLSRPAVEAIHISFEGKINLSEAWRLATFSTPDPLAGGERAEKNLERVKALDVQGYFSEKNLFAGLTPQRIADLKKLKIPLTSLRHFAHNNGREPVEALKKALCNLVELVKFDVQAFFIKERLPEGLPAKRYEEIKHFIPSLGKLWRLAAHNRGKPVESLERALRNFFMVLKYKVPEGCELSISDAWFFAVGYMTDPLAGVNKALGNLPKILSFDIRRFFEKAGPLKDLTIEHQEEMKSIKLTAAEAWHFAITNIADPIKGLRQALRYLPALYNFNVQKYIEDEGLLAGLSPEKRDQLKKLVLTPAEKKRFAIQYGKKSLINIKTALRNLAEILRHNNEIPISNARYIAFNNLNKPLEKLEGVLRGIPVILGFDIQAFIESEGLLNGLTATRQEELKEFTLSPADAWTFSIQNTPAPLTAAKKALRALPDLLKFNVPGFLREAERKELEAFELTLADAWDFAVNHSRAPLDRLKKVLLNLTELMRSDISKHLKFTLADAWRFAVHNLDDPLKSVRQAAENLPKILEYDIRGFIKKQAEFKGLAPERRAELEQFQLTPAEARIIALRQLGEPLERVREAALQIILIMKKFNAPLLQARRMTVIFHFRDPVEAFERFTQMRPVPDEETWQKVLANMGLVNYFANKYLGRGLDFDDLAGEGTFGLMRAVQLFDPHKGAKFSTYASFWIRNKIQMAIANQGRTVRVPVHRQERFAQLERARHLLCEEFGREATNEEIAAHLEIDLSALQEILKTAGQGEVSFQKPVGAEGDGELLDLTPDRAAADPLGLVINRDLRIKLEKEVQKLPNRRMREVIRSRFGLSGRKSKTMEEIGERYGVTREWIRQIEKEALQILMERLPELKDFLKD
ncbi:sigma-70 family RNA polymerase sigma factor [Candidatus Saganbacteria bacterium]|nr:sigma-70 family RNA polymerase sigma factor [Candidatus Saganbacteria bacterium]